MISTTTIEARHHVRVPPKSQETGGPSAAPLLAARTRVARSGAA